MMDPQVLLFLPLTDQGRVGVWSPLPATPAGGHVCIVQAVLNSAADLVQVLGRENHDLQAPQLNAMQWCPRVLDQPGDVMTTLFSPHNKSMASRLLRWYGFQNGVKSKSQELVIRDPVQDWNEPAVMSLEERRGFSLGQALAMVPRLWAGMENKYYPDGSLDVETTTHIWLRLCSCLLGNRLP